MPRYFFNTRIENELITDPEGEVLRDADRAWEMARAMIRELLKTEGADGALLNAVIEVTDEAGEVVLEFPFTEAILDVPDRSVTKHCRCAKTVPRYTEGPHLFRYVFRLRCGGEISETAIQESHHRRHRACPREEIKASVRGEHHDELFDRAAQPVAGRCFLRCIHVCCCRTAARNAAGRRCSARRHRAASSGVADDRATGQ
jgi:hypothetical protein